MSAETIADILTDMDGMVAGFPRSMRLPFTVGTWRDIIQRIASAASDENLNAGQRPGDGQLCVHSPAGGARHSAFDLEGRKCAK